MFSYSGKQLNYCLLFDSFRYDVVMDVGCGSGRVTSLIDCRLRCNQIIAIDIDVKAIKYAQVNFTSPRIVYSKTDIAQPWENLDPEIRQLENKVNLIISNRVFHWIENKDLAVQNLYRLLKKGGKQYANVTTLWDPFVDLSKEQKEHYKSIIAIPTEEEQVKLFDNLFKQNKFSKVVLESSNLRQIYSNEAFKKGKFNKQNAKIQYILIILHYKTVILPYFPNLTKKYIIEKDIVKRNKIMSSGLRDLIKESFLKRHCREVKSGDGDLTEFELTYGQIRIYAQK